MKIVAVFEMLAGVAGLVVYVLFGMTSPTMLLLLCLLPIVGLLSLLAGYWLFRQQRRGVIWSRVVQIVQLPAIAMPYFSYKLGLGLFLVFGAGLAPSTDGVLKLRSNAEFQLGAVHAWNISTDPEPLPQTSYGVNVVALVLLIVLMRARRDAAAT